ncbi:hypothetical protein B0H11DRAFT_1908082 [Mycena galericulata]|nr:hypothetical protein B0H11DRAFT_1908082 [Mycena galericulata]
MSVEDPAAASNIPAAGKVTGGRRWPPVTLGGHWQMLMDTVSRGAPVGVKIRYGFRRSTSVFTGPLTSLSPFTRYKGQYWVKCERGILAQKNRVPPLTHVLGQFYHVLAHQIFNPFTGSILPVANWVMLSRYTG